MLLFHSFVFISYLFVCLFMIFICLLSYLFLFVIVVVAVVIDKVFVIIIGSILSLYIPFKTKINGENGDGAFFDASKYPSPPPVDGTKPAPVGRQLFNLQYIPIGFDYMAV